MSDQPSDKSTPRSPDRPKVIAGLVLFVILVAFPVWYSAASPLPDRDQDGKPDYRPLPQRPVGATSCIESTEYMRASHMDLLDEWRNSVVRDDQYEHVSKKDGQKWQRSLSKTCMGCHTSQQKFCGECHDYLGVAPDCWICHVEPERIAGASAGAPLPTPAVAPTPPGRM